MTGFELERAIAESELVLHYQPVVAVPDRTLRGVEALSRWRHPARGLVSPLQFIPEAEANGLLIRRLTFWVLREALLQGNVWRRDGVPLTVGVNLSVHNLHDAHFRRFLELTLKVAGGPEFLVAEVSSAALADDPDPPLETIQLMRGHGIRVVLDDLSEAQSARLEHIPADVVKIARSLVGRIAWDDAARREVGELAARARDRDREVVAVGVEDAATWERLAELGIGGAQGFFVARPMPVAELAAWRLANS